MMVQVDTSLSAFEDLPDYQNINKDLPKQQLIVSSVKLTHVAPMTWDRNKKTRQYTKDSTNWRLTYSSNYVFSNAKAIYK